MDPLEVLATGLFGAIIGVIFVIVLWQILKWVFPGLRKIDLL
jgi:hypothetical protein